MGIPSVFGCAAVAALSVLALPLTLHAQIVPSRTVVASHWAFDVPAGWEDVALAAASVVAHVREPRMRGGLPINVNLNVEAYAGGALAYAAAAVAGLRGIGRVESQRPVTFNGYSGLLVTTAWRGGAVPYRTLQFITARDGNGYVLTCTGAISAWRVALPLCNASLRTMRPTDR